MGMTDEMNDPWDVKSVRHAGQYMSCMKINGVPLLPPVLSKECRKEMQYYKLLAKEVEKRISYLKPYLVESDSDTSEDKTDAPDLPESEQNYELPKDNILGGFDVNIEKITAITSEKPLNKFPDSPEAYAIGDCNNITSNITLKNADSPPALSNSPTFLINLSLSGNETGGNILETLQRTPIELPERDYDSPKKKVENENLSNLEIIEKNKTEDALKNVVNPGFHKETLSDPFPDISITQDGPSSLSSKSFTGSLNDLHTDSMKESQMPPALIRQRSYTLLKPSPQLLAHLEVQSLNTGVEMHSISMSESMSNLSSPHKKRRSWDLESAKVKWSSMALELNSKNVTNASKCNVNKTIASKPVTKKPSLDIPSPVARAKSVTQEKPRRASLSAKIPSKSEPIQRVMITQSPVRNANSISNRINGKDTTPSKTNGQKKEAIPTKAISDSEDPASRVRELYEKIHKQQLAQMASLVEKQKREQMLLQQVFEEQNNLLYKQLKSICPKSPIEIKEAWGDKIADTVDRGPVSLSQLIKPKSLEQSPYDSPVSTTLTDTNNYLNHCDKVLKKSRDITGSIKKQSHSRTPNDGSSDSPKTKGEGSRTRTHSPINRNTSRRLDYDTSASSDREYDPMLTDRTNDTLADLNVTFPSDFSDDGRSIKHNGITPLHMSSKDLAMVHRNTTPNGVVSGRSAESSIRSLEQTIYNSMNNIGKRHIKPQVFNRQPTSQERAAATKIVAHAKGYLVRRLMRTERVQGTVQTIRDALLCALQLHQDREGIRGADVDLHRRLIQQITAACYSLHDTFVASTAAERCAVIAADRGRRRSLAAKQTTPRPHRPSDIMSQSHSGSFPARVKRSSASPMTQSNYETFSGDKWCLSTRRSMPSPRRRPWR